MRVANFLGKNNCLEVVVETVFPDDKKKVFPSRTTFGTLSKNKLVL